MIVTRNKITFDFLSVADKHGKEACVDAVVYAVESSRGKIESLTVDEESAQITVLFENANVRNVCLGVKRRLGGESEATYMRGFNWRDLSIFHQNWYGSFTAKVS